MSDITVLQVTQGDVTNIIVRPHDISHLVVRNQDISILQAAPATITVSDIQLSDDDPLELANTAFSGTSTKAARSDHRHPSTGMYLDGGNF
jgi:hypothetical protein